MSDETPYGRPTTLFLRPEQIEALEAAQDAFRRAGGPVTVTLGDAVDGFERGDKVLVKGGLVADDQTGMVINDPVRFDYTNGSSNEMVQDPFPRRTLYPYIYQRPERTPAEQRAVRKTRKAQRKARRGNR